MLRPLLAGTLLRVSRFPVEKELRGWSVRASDLNSWNFLQVSFYSTQVKILETEDLKGAYQALCCCNNCTWRFFVFSLSTAFISLEVAESLSSGHVKKDANMSSAPSM